ncbi:hypothetical protein PROFUN_16619, partial [Planoprotostelium fungivorum]
SYMALQVTNDPTGANLVMVNDDANIIANIAGTFTLDPSRPITLRPAPGQVGAITRVTLPGTRLALTGNWIVSQAAQTAQNAPPGALRASQALARIAATLGFVLAASCDRRFCRKLVFCDFAHVVVEGY